MEESPTWWVFQNQQPLLIADWNHDERFSVFKNAIRAQGIALRSICRLPLTTTRRRLGAFGIASLQPRNYSEEEIRFLSLLADGLAIAIENALNFDASCRAQVELERQNADLQRSEAFLAQGQSISHTGSFGWSVLSEEIYWSEETYNIFQHDRAVKPTMGLVLQRIHPDDRGREQQALDHATNEKTDFDIEHRLLIPDGSVKHVHVLARALEPSSGNLEYVGAVTDVTAARQAEQTLRESEAYLAEAQRLSHTGSWAWAPGTGDIRYWSEECFRVLGFDPHGGQPRFGTFFERIHPDDQAKFREMTQKAWREKAESRLEYRIVHHGCEISDIHVVGHPLLSPSGDLVEFVGTVIDITERKRAE